MLDINFYMKFDEILKKLESKKIWNKEQMFEELEKIRSAEPVVYNIETTNRCNMRCKMCPRTTMMTRKIEDIDRETFIKVIDQIKPHSAEEWESWKSFCKVKYGISEDDEASENHFFLYIISKVIQLHGYGDPLLDKNMHEYVKILHDRGFYSYFSCNPANINLELTYKMLDAGLDYIKYSIESVDDAVHKKIRGEQSDFSESYKKIQKVLDYKHKNDLHTTVVITMLDLNRANQQEDYEKLMAAFGGMDVYIYLKSEDCQWYRKDFHGTKSIHWSEVCKHPWMTMTIKSNGQATMCMEDFNNEIILGDVHRQPLKEIWDSEKYRQFRRNHIEVREGIKCSGQCDMKLIGELLD
jgi:radical SAM protein with 4Fe4S-binding SPASM domain|nr:radical SAM/SPASM domain-containing protein [uncultured Acetatifactor sp.]